MLMSGIGTLSSLADIESFDDGADVVEDRTQAHPDR